MTYTFCAGKDAWKIWPQWNSLRLPVTASPAYDMRHG